MHFKELAHQNMGNAQLQRNLDKIKGKFVAKRGDEFSCEPGWKPVQK